MISRLFSIAYLWILRAAFDRRERRAAFSKMTVFVVVNLWLSNFLKPQPKWYVAEFAFPVFRNLVTILLVNAWIWAVVMELGDYNNNLISIDPLIPFFVSDMLVIVYGLHFFLIYVLSVHTIISLMNMLTLIFLLVYEMRWSEASKWALNPVVVRFQKSTRFVNVVAWYKLDVCFVVPAQAVPMNVWPFPAQIDISPAEWPMMEELPWWISMKISQRAANAG